jgi:hypothetical protein
MLEDANANMVPSMVQGKIDQDKFFMLQGSKHLPEFWHLGRRKTQMLKLT